MNIQFMIYYSIMAVIILFFIFCFYAASVMGEDCYDEQVKMYYEERGHYPTDEQLFQFLKEKEPQNNNI